jgi:hypothetical protein
VSQIADDKIFCKFCTEVETEEHFLISCHKNKYIRKTFFQSYGLDLKDSHNTYFLLSKLLNPKNIIECNYLYKFIRDALEISFLYFSTEFAESFFSWNFRFQIISTPLYDLNNEH